jgi:hypothetical protein
MPADHKAARYCAVTLKRDKSQLLDGRAILALIYTNGYGVTKDLDLTTKFVCEMYRNDKDDSIFDLISFIRLSISSYGKDFDICDDA